MSLIRRLTVWVILLHHFMCKLLSRGWRSKSYILEAHHGNSFYPAGTYCVFAYYEQEPQVSLSVRNLLKSLNTHGVNVILMANAPLSARQMSTLKPLCHVVLQRQNVGMDFGAYRDGFLYVRRHVPTCGRVMFLNDSIYYLSHGLNGLVSGLMGEKDVIAACKNSDPSVSPHIQSFAFSLSEKVFSSEEIKSFWLNFKPSNNRVVNIELGEKALSGLLLKLFDHEVIYAPEKLLAFTQHTAPTNLAVYAKTLKQSHAFRRYHFELPEVDGNLLAGVVMRDFIANLAEFVAKGSPLHSAPQYLALLLACPMWKKDAVYRQQYDQHTYVRLFSDFASDQELREFKQLIINKGSYANLSYWGKFMHSLGVR